MHTNLQRNSTDKIIAGVCGGLARRFGADSVMVRLIFLAWLFFLAASMLMLVSGEHQAAVRLFVFSGLSFCFSPVVYLVLWIAMPKEPAVPPRAHVLQQASPAGPYNPTGEWQFDPYTGRSIRHERSGEY